MKLAAVAYINLIDYNLEQVIVELADNATLYDALLEAIKCPDISLEREWIDGLPQDVKHKEMREYFSNFDGDISITFYQPATS